MKYDVKAILIVALLVLPSAYARRHADKEDGHRSRHLGHSRHLGGSKSSKGENRSKRSIKMDRSTNIADTARKAKTGKKHVGISGLHISPPGHTDEVDLVVSTVFSAGCRVTASDGSSQPCDTGRIVLTSAEDEPTFTVLSTDEMTGETSGFSMSGGKKFFKVSQQKNLDANATDASDEVFTPPAWACHNEMVGHATKDEEERRRLLGVLHE